ncbi:hypothetical protein BSKO_02954 [Bryopsis sp. KO-2023]|nr:hypothetical protein BSKO_02954 [Bryopsis sp. KO-2023]
MLPLGVACSSGMHSCNFAGQMIGESPYGENAPIQTPAMEVGVQQQIHQQRWTVHGSGTAFIKVHINQRNPTPAP